jgi:chromosome segregation ATPase
MSDVEQRITRVEARLDAVETARSIERRELSDVLERIFSKLNDVHTRLTVQQSTGADLKKYVEDLNALKTQFATSEASTASSLKTLGIVGTVATTIGTAIGWVISTFFHK